MKRQKLQNQWILGVLGMAMAVMLWSVAAPVRAATGTITFSTAAGSSFNEAGFNVSSFWVQNGSDQGGHLHVFGGVENHHFQGNNARQGLIISALDNSSFNLCSIDATLTGSFNNPNLEVGTAFPSLNPGNAVPGYTQIPVPGGTILITGFDNVTTLYITSQSSHTWDNIVLCESSTVSTFVVTFNFEDENNWDSSIAHISCNGGLPLTSDSAPLMDDDSVTFVLEFPDAGAGVTDCDVWVDDVNIF